MSNTNLPTQTSSVLHNDTVSSCSTSKVQEKTQLLRSRCMNSLREVKSQFKFLSETLQDFGTMHIFKRTFSQDLNLLEQHLTKDILSQTDCNTTLTKLRTKFKNAFNSEFEEFFIQNTCSEKEDSNSETTSNKSVLSKEDLKGTRIEHGFKRAFMSLFGQDNETFTSMMLLNIDQLQKQLEKDEFQEDGSMAAFWKSVAERTRHQRQYDRRLNKRQMQTQKSKIDTDIRPIYDEKLMVEVQFFAIGQQQTEQLEISHEDKARKKTQERDRNSKTSVMPSARFQSTADGSKPKPRSTNHSTRSLPVSKSSYVTITAMPKADHSKNSSSFSDSKHFVCSTCQKGHIFSPNKTSAVYEKTSPRSDLRWKPTGRIFKTIGLRWVPTGKILASCTRKDDSEPTHGSNVDIPNIDESKQTLDLSAGTSINVQKEQSFDLSAGTSNSVKPDNLRVWLLKKLISQKPMLKWIQNRSTK
ncbi:hypothetical protein Tco_0971742 [Tanacetum coccineum]